MAEEVDTTASEAAKLVLYYQECERKAKKYDAIEKKKAGRPSDKEPANVIAVWMSTFCTAFRGSRGEIFIRVKGIGIVPLTNVNSNDPQLRDIISHAHYKLNGYYAKIKIVEEACRMFLASAKLDAVTQQTALRVAHLGSEDNWTILIDRATEELENRFIKITKDDVTLESDSGSIYFVRENYMDELPPPDKNSTFSTLPPFLNLHSEEKKVIFLWAMQTLLPMGSYMHCIFDAMTGSGKSTVVDYVRALTDPRKGFFDEAGIPKERSDFMAKAIRAHVLSFDNIAEIPRWFAETVCRVARGEHTDSRTYYTNTGLTETVAKNPLIAAGVRLIGRTNDEFRRRSLILRLPQRPEGTNKTEGLLKEEFDAMHPQFLGALCNAIRGALAHIHEVRRYDLEGAADFKRWMIAAGIELGWTEEDADELLRKYQDPKRTIDALNGSGFLKLVVLFLTKQKDYRYEGTPGWLHSELQNLWFQASGRPTKLPPDFPVDATRLVMALKNAHAILASQNIIAVFSTKHIEHGDLMLMQLVAIPEEMELANYEQTMYDVPTVHDLLNEALG
jgi:hypothetical protein